MKRSQGQGRRMRGGEETFGLTTTTNNANPVQVSPTVLPPAEEGITDQVTNTFAKLSETTTGALSSAENTLGSAQNSVVSGFDAAKEKSSGFLNSINPFGSSSEAPVAPVASGALGAPAEEEKGMFSSFGFGGRRRSRQMKMKGGLNQDFGYDAAPVTNANVAQPTYMMSSKGGRRRRSCKKRRKCCKKSCKKRHRHHKR
jgi:hypothetical protein